MAASVSKLSLAVSAVKGAPTTSGSNSDEGVFPGIDDKMDTTDFRAHDHVIVKCHNRPDSRVPIVNLSEYSLSFFPFLMPEQSNVTKSFLQC